MGIPAYFSHIVKKHPNIIYKLLPMYSCENLYLDGNSFIYEAIYNFKITILTEDAANTIINIAFAYIKEHIRLIKPRFNILLAFDGVAPRAKLDQQRNRRFKSSYQHQLTKSILKSADVDPWNTAAITPGTPFFQLLDARLAAEFADPIAYNLTGKLMVSGSNQCGEGEHKIFQYIRDNPLEHTTQTTVIYGLDADLIMLAINHLPISPRIFLFRETPEFIKSINSELEPNENYLLDIPELAHIITLDMNNGISLAKESPVYHNRIYDYIQLCILLGNDFMPHFPAINIRTGGIDKLLMAYKATLGSTDQNLTDGKTIFWKNNRKVFEFLAKSEEEYFKQEHKLRDRKEKYKLPNESPQEKVDNFINIPTFERSVEKYINPFKANWRKRYYQSLFDIDINEERCRQICVNYLEGIEWTTKYYTTGCPDWRWCYKYNYPPLLSDLVRYIPYFNSELIENKPANPVTDLVQLCYVMPRNSLHLLPNPKLYNALCQKKADMYITECDFSWAYCRYFWECHPNLPHIDLTELEHFVNLHK